MYKKKFVRMLSIINMFRTTRTWAGKRVTWRILAFLLMSSIGDRAHAANSLLGWLNGEGHHRGAKQQGRPSLPKDVVAVPVDKLQPSRKVNGEPHAVDPKRLARLQQLAPKDRAPIDIDIHRHEVHIHNGHHRAAVAKAEGMDFVRSKPMNPIALSDAPRNVHGRPIFVNQAGPAVNPALKKEPWRPKFGRK